MNNIDHIINRIISGNPRLEDQQQLDLWLAQSEENRKEFARQQSLWQAAGRLKVDKSPDLEVAWQDLQQRIAALPKKKSGSPLRIAAGIALIAALSVVLIFLVNGGSDQKKLAQMDGGPSVVEIQPLLDEVLIQELVDSSSIPASGSESITPKQGSRKKKNLLITYATQDSAKAFYLPDSSIVFLNEKSSLVYNADFSKKNRDLVLQGEAYFEVANHPLPFSVRCGNTQTQGSRSYFNVRQDAKSGQVEVLTVSGTLEFTGVSKKEIKSLQLVKGEKVTYSQDGVLRKEKNKDKEQKWWQAKNLRASLKAFISKLKSIFY